MFTLAVILFGAVSFSRLKINLLPELTYPTLTIRTDYPGAAPAEIENLITKPIEEAVGVVENVNRVSSVSRSGQSDVILEFNWGTEMDYAGLDVREKLDALDLPLDVPRPSILRFDPSLDPIMRYAFYRKSSGKVTAHQDGEYITFDEDELKFIRRFSEEEIKKELEGVPGVAAVKVSGGLEEQIQILVDQGKLAQLGIPINRIADRVGAENINLSGGRLKEGQRQYLVRTLNQFKSLDEIQNLVLTVGDQRKKIYLKDIADIRYGYRERTAVTRLDGEEAVEIAVYREGDANTVTVAREVGRKISRVRDILPEGYEMEKIYDQSVFITGAVNEVIRAALIGGVLAVLILYFFLRNFWATVIISLSIPVSVIATFNLMYGADLSLNIMSLGGIALGIGMLLDNSIVVLENIARHREKGKDALKAVRDGASEVGGAVTASTLTTVAVFLPLVFVRGISGQLFRDQALTVTFALLVSLFVALTLIPMLASFAGRKGKAEPEKKPRPVPRTAAGRWLRRSGNFLFTTIPVFAVTVIRKVASLVARVILTLISPFLRLFEKFYGAAESRYRVLLTWGMNHRISVVALSAAIFVLTMLLVPGLGMELIPQLSQGEFRVEAKLPPGTPLERTDMILAGLQRDYGRPVKSIFSVAGSGNRMDANPEHGGENWGELSVNLQPGSGRDQEELVMDRLRKKMRDIPDLQYKFYRPTLFTFKTPIEVEISGYDLRSLKRVSGQIAEKLDSSSRFTDVKNSMKSGHPEIQVIFDRQRTASLGFAVYQVADRVVDQIRGDVATRYLLRDRKIDVLVRARENERNSVEKIRRLIVNPESERPVTLDAVADVVINTGPGEIRRVDQERVALITANLGYGDLAGAAEEIDRVIDGIAMPEGLSARVAGQNREMATSFRSLQFALLLAVFLVYLVMASQFESFLHPFIILFTIPLALVGVVLALFITGSTISVVVFIGLILLAGIVVNNAIVLIDLVNKLRADGMEKREAIVTGSHLRLRPIMMTMLTTALGLLPLALGVGEGAEVRAPMAITVIGGLLISTLLTLVVIPVVYDLLDRKVYHSPAAGELSGDRER